MNGDVLTLEDLIALIREHWPERYARGRILHVHRNAIRVPSGALIHLRLMVQRIADDDPAYYQTGDPAPCRDTHSKPTT